MDFTKKSVAAPNNISDNSLRKKKLHQTLTLMLPHTSFSMAFIDMAVSSFCEMGCVHKCARNLNKLKKRGKSGLERVQLDSLVLNYVGLFILWISGKPEWADNTIVVLSICGMFLCFFFPPRLLCLSLSLFFLHLFVCYNVPNIQESRTKIKK